MEHFATWPEERATEAKRLFFEGLSYSEIARRLGVTKNAVVGKANRGNWPEERRARI